jgi:hypothetical protein
MVCSFSISSLIANLQRFAFFFFRYCVPMDNTRPALDLGHIDKICPDENGTPKPSSMNGRLL